MRLDENVIQELATRAVLETNLVCRVAVLPANVTGRRIARAKHRVFLHRERVEMLMPDQHIQNDGRFPLKMALTSGPGQLTGNQHIRVRIS